MSDESCWWLNLTDVEFQEAFRMSKKTVIDLQAEIDYYEDRNVDRVNTMLLACLWFLGNTHSFNEVGRLFKLNNVEFAVQTYLLKILKLAESYILWPSMEESMSIEQGFISEHRFPGVIGVIGSLHMEINGKDEDNADAYFNEVMGKHTIVTQIVCDNNLLLRDVCVGCPGGKSIKQILESSPLYSLLTDEHGILYKNAQHLLGGTEHPALRTLLIPYRTNEKGEVSEKKYKFNSLHSSVMSTMEEVLVNLENRFPRIVSMDKLKPDLASTIASCVCILHNFTRIRNDGIEFYTQ